MAVGSLISFPEEMNHLSGKMIFKKNFFPFKMKIDTGNEKIDLDKKIEDFEKLHPVRYQEIVDCLNKKHPTLTPDCWGKFWFEMLCEKKEQKFNMPARQLVEKFRR